MPNHDSFPPLPTQEAVEFAPSSEIVRAELAPAAGAPEEPPPRPRRVVLPVVLFLLTCLSTFFAGVTDFAPQRYLDDMANFTGEWPDPYLLIAARRAVLANWENGVLYMTCVLAILMTHEMGHFLMTIVYRVRASLPYFIPFPISAIGTMGAVIGMDGMKADRREIFDIGLAGPLAGLVVAIPIICVGAQQLDLQNIAPVGERFNLPLALRWAVDYFHPGAYRPEIGLPISRLNPYFMAGWVGMIVTALNMLPVSQLDGGHVTYALFGRAAHWIARLFMLGVFVYLGVMFAVYRVQPIWLPMALLVLLLGTDHPPTRDDTVPLGWFRTVLGLASLLIPVICFAPNPFFT